MENAWCDVFIQICKQLNYQRRIYKWLKTSVKLEFFTEKHTLKNGVFKNTHWIANGDYEQQFLTGKNYHIYLNG